MKFKSIKEKGGLSVQVRELGYNYTLLDLLFRAKVPDTITAHVLMVDRNRQDKPARSTIKHWREVWLEERSTKRHEHETQVEELKK